MIALTVVVVSINPPEVLARTLEALVPQVDLSALEVLVIRRRASAPAAVSALRALYPMITWLEGGDEDNVPRLRGKGWSASRGRIVAWIEDDCIPDPDWCAAVLESHETGHLGIGGSVAPGEFRRARDWAVFFCEFGRFIPPVQTGEALSLAGNHLSYKRTGLEDLVGAAGPGVIDLYFETRINPMILDRGLGLKLDGDLVVRNEHAWQAADLIRSPYHHGRGYAGLRLADTSIPNRLLRAAGALILPVLLTARAARAVFRRPQYRRVFLRAVPWVLVFNTAWAVGELAGALLGPGRSPDQWK